MARQSVQAGGVQQAQPTFQEGGTDRSDQQRELQDTERSGPENVTATPRETLHLSDQAELVPINSWGGDEGWRVGGRGEGGYNLLKDLWYL